MQFERLAIAHHATPQMPGVANKNVKNLKLRGPSKVDNKSLAAGALTARTNQSSDSADNGVNLERLLRAKEVFARADEDKGGSLDVNEFVAAFKGVLTTDDGDSPDALRRLFARIDANADGSIDWREFSTYILLENDSAASLRGGEDTITYGSPVSIHDATGHIQHNDMITSMISLPAKGHMKERYVTTGKDGTFRFWQAKDLQPCGVMRTGSAWLTAAAATPVSYKLCTASYARTINIYDLQGMEPCGNIPELMHSPVCMDSWRRPTSATEELLAVGDIGGCVTVFNLEEHATEEKRSENRWGLHQLWRQQLHKDWVCQLQYVSELNSVLSCSLDKRLCLADVEARVTVKYLEGHTAGVRCVNWSKAYSFIASGGLDRNVMLWNPFQLQAMATLKGHTAAVTHVAINERSSQVISLAADKIIKVWDIRNNRCLQTMTDKQAYRPENFLTCLLYDPKHEHLMSGAVLPKMWPAVHLTPDSSLRRHRHPVCQMVYNSTYAEVITADTSGLICVWKVSTGALRVRWADAHDGARITAMAFDLNFRRLITGCDSGGLKVWNFSTGACLKELAAVTNQEITAVICLTTMLKRQFIVSVGWDRRLFYYEDTKADKRPVPACRIVPDARVEQQAGAAHQGHTSDVLTAAMQGNHTLVTGGYDGLLVVWNTDSGAIHAHLSPPGLSQRPLQERSIEQVLFVGSRLPYVLASVGADGYLRLWNAKQLQLLAQVHVSPDGLTAVCVDPRQLRLAVADATGSIHIYCIAKWKHGRSRQPAVTRRVHWAAHTGSICFLQWMQHSAAVDLIMSASADKRAAVWVPEPGTLVGDFGQQQLWDADNPNTWKDSSQTMRATKDVEQHLQQTCSSSGTKQAVACLNGDVSEESDAYSSGDDMLPDCFTEPPALV